MKTIGLLPLSNTKLASFLNIILKWFITKNNVFIRFFFQRKLNSLISVCPIQSTNCEIISVYNSETFWLIYINKWPSFQIYASVIASIFLASNTVPMFQGNQLIFLIDYILCFSLIKCTISEAKQGDLKFSRTFEFF